MHSYYFMVFPNFKDIVGIVSIVAIIPSNQHNLCPKDTPTYSAKNSIDSHLEYVEKSVFHCNTRRGQHCNIIIICNHNILTENTNSSSTNTCTRQSNGNHERKHTAPIWDDKISLNQHCWAQAFLLDKHVENVPHLLLCHRGCRITLHRRRPSASPSLSQDFSS